MTERKIILASSSPRRIQLLKENGLDPVVLPPDADETIPPDTEPRIAVMFLALKKALSIEAAIKEGCSPGDAIIAADTVVVYRNDIIGKPKGAEEAFNILKRLNGRKHTVFTGVALIIPKSCSRKVFYEASDVYFKTCTDEEISAYVNTPEPYDKAGGYAVQGAWGKNIDRIDGDTDNVIGLPVKLVLFELNTIKSPRHNL